MRNLTQQLIFILILVFFTTAHASQISRIKSCVQSLSSDGMEGRLCGTKGERCAAQYIASQFSQMGLKPAGDNGTYYQAFRINENLKGYNVLAKLESPEKASSTIIISAHLDHLGRDKFVYPGADDNASGVSAMLETALYLSRLKAHGKLHGNKDILFAAFSGEEKGILGSSHFINTTRKESIYAAINLDMVGHLRGILMLQGAGSSADWNKLIDKIKLNYQISFAVQNDPYLPTDATAFYINGIPVLNLFTGAHKNYHTPLDTPDTLNYQGIRMVSHVLTDLVLALLERQDAVHYAYVKKTHEYFGQGRKIYLGTIPDYSSSDIDGIKLSGVTKDSPAERAGLKRDDIVVELAGKKIHDIYNYTSVLNALQVGKSQKMVVMRDEKKLEMIIIPRSLHCL